MSRPLDFSHEKGCQCRSCREQRAKRRKEQRREQRRRQRKGFISNGLTSKGKIRKRQGQFRLSKALLPRPPEIIGLSYQGMTPDQRKIYNRWQYERHHEPKRLRNLLWNKRNLEKRKSAQKIWRDANKEYLRQYMVDWIAENRRALLQSQSEQRLKKLTNPQYIQERIKKQAIAREKEEKRIFEKSLAEALKISLRLHWEERKKLRWRDRESLGQKIRATLRSRIRKQIKGLKKTDGTMEIVGCSTDQLKCHLQAQFRGSMNWENYGPVWHIDHIVPCSYFDFSKPEEIRRCYHFSNLRPLWAKQNMREGDRRGPLTPFLF